MSEQCYQWIKKVAKHNSYSNGAAEGEYELVRSLQADEQMLQSYKISVAALAQEFPDFVMACFRLATGGTLVDSEE